MSLRASPVLSRRRVKASLHPFGVEVLPQDPQGGFAGQGLGPQNPKPLPLGGGEGGDAPAEDPRLLPGHVLQGRAQDLEVVVADVGDHGEDGLCGVGGVQAPPQAHLEDGELNPLPGEVEEGEGGGGLKEARLQALGVGTELRQKREELLLGDRPSLNLDALPEVHQVGAGVEAHPKPRLLQDGGEGPGGGALPVRPPHEGHGFCVHGVAGGGEEGPDPLQARGEAALPGVEPGEGVHLPL